MTIQTIKQVVADLFGSDELRSKRFENQITRALQAQRDAGAREERARCVEVVKSWSSTDCKGFFGLQVGGGLVKGMTIDDYKRVHAKQIIEALTPPTK